MKLQYKAINPEDQATADKLLSKVTVDENGCWRYRATATLTMTTYYTIRQKLYAIFVDATHHNDSYITTTCNTKSCVNPNHLCSLRYSTRSARGAQDICNRHIRVLPNGCWRWCNLNGGEVTPIVRDMHNNITVTAAQFVWSTYRNKVLPAGLMLKTTCGDTLCVNPEHKEVVSRTCLVKPKYGTDANTHVLTEEQVIAMRRLRETSSMRFDKIAEKFGVSPRTAWLVCTYRTWKHVQKQ